MNIKYKIIYTITDEAPALSSFSLLPIISMFINADTNIHIETYNISLSHRILASFPNSLNDTQKVNDYLFYLNQIIHTPDANIIKLPNISASLPQLIAAIKELQKQKYNIPKYIDNPKNSQEHKIKYLYNNVKGSAVNPILRIGNSYRYIPYSVKKYAKKNLVITEKWSEQSLTHVSSMKHGDFYHNEKSLIIDIHKKIKIILIKKDGTQQILNNNIIVNKHDIIDTSVMEKKSLVKFINQTIKDTKKQNILLSIHLKASMMKISDPIIFGIIVQEFYKKIIIKYHKYIKNLKINFNNGISEFYKIIEYLPKNIQNSIYKDLEHLYNNQPKLAMVDSVKQVTNLHTPNGIIIDSSMSIMIRDAGKMWGPDGKLHDVNAIIPDSCYSGIYQAMIEDCKKHGAFNPSNIGSMSNIGLMAESAEEYGSHNNTFQIPDDGCLVQVVDQHNKILMEHLVDTGDIWRLCHTSNQSIKNWIKLGINQSQKTNIPTIIWLDPMRAHDLCLIQKIKYYLNNFHNINSNIQIMSPVNAMLFSIKKIRNGQNVMSITGNVLRDYLTDLFPIIELGTSSNMLSVINLISGGMLFEAGSGGSAPKHVQQFLQENHLRWNSLGEFLALSASLEYIAVSKNHLKAKLLFNSLNQAIDKILLNNKLPSKESKKLDSRGQHFYLARYWSEALASQNIHQKLQQKFKKLSQILIDNESIIINELIKIQGSSIDIGGYYHPDIKKTNNVMRPSITLNAIVDNIIHTK